MRLGPGKDGCEVWEEEGRCNYGILILLSCSRIIESLQPSFTMMNNNSFPKLKNVSDHLSNHSVGIFLSLSVLAAGQATISHQTYYCCDCNPAHTTLGIQQVIQATSESALDNDENTTNAETK